MWSSSYGMENRYQNSPYANGANRTNNPHFDKNGDPNSEKAKKIAAKIDKVSNNSARQDKAETKGSYTRFK